MAWNGSGNFARLYSWQSDRDTAIKIRADRMDGEFDNFKAGLENCLTRTGETSPSANTPWNNFKITGLANGTVSGDAVNFDQLQSANLSIGSLRNILRNSSFAVAQRGTSFASPASGSMTLDGWRVFYDGTSGTFAVTQDRTVSADLSYALRWNQTVAGTSVNVYIEQRIPNLRNFSNRPLIGYWLQSAAFIVGGFLGKVEIGGNYGTGGAPSAAEVYSSKTFGAVYGTTYQTQRDFTLSVSNLAAKTFGTNGDDYLFVRLYLPSNVNLYDGYFNAPVVFALPQGSSIITSPTAFPYLPYRSFDEEMNLCRAFYYRLGESANSVIVNSYGAAGQNHDITLVHPVQMRAAPTATKNGVWTLVNCAQPSLPVTTNRTAILRTAVTALGAFSYTADSTDDYLAFDADL